jgi:hypothetical protein
MNFQFAKHPQQFNNKTIQQLTNGTHKNTTS